MLCKQQITLSFDGRSDAVFAATVKDLLARAPYATLIPADCEGIRIVNRMREHMPERITPMPDLATLNLFDDKWRFHEFCARHALPVPAQRLFHDKSCLRFSALVAEFGLPFVLKPVNQAGSLGVLVIHSRAQYEQMVAAEGQYSYSPIIAQQYIEGDDVDISLLSMRGRLSAFAIQQVQGSQIHFLAHPQLEAIAERLCAASRFHGVMHIDARRESDTGRLYLIESNPRFWATLTASVWCGLNFVAESVRESARPAGPLRLTAGSASTRHPLMRPSAWVDLLRGSGEQGRLLRAMTFDLPSIGNLARELPRRAMTYRQRRTAALPNRLVAARGKGING